MYVKRFFTMFLIFYVLLNTKAYSKENEIVLNAKNALLYDYTYQEVLYEKNSGEKIANASTTKILTAIVAYENSNMDDWVVVGENVSKVSGSKIGLKMGDKIKMSDLMKGLLISSGNDAAIAIAEHVAGNVDDFCVLMNEKALLLGAQNTNFLTPHGLDAENHYSTIVDLLVFSKCFIKNEYLMKIANTEKDLIRIGEYEKELYATNEMLFIYDGVNGIKTGYTNNAGRCLITSIVSGDRNLISMVFGCDSKNHRTEDTKKLLIYGFESFEEIDLSKSLTTKNEIRVKKAKIPRLELKIKGEKKLLLKKGLEKELKIKYEIPEVLTAPISSGSVVGWVKICLKDKIWKEIPLRMPCEIEKKDAFQFLKGIYESQISYIEVKV